MRLRRLVPVVLLGALVPFPAFAAVCFSVAAGASSFGTMVLAIEGQGEQFFDLVGQVVAPCNSAAAGERVTLTGSARLDAAGNAEFSATVPGTAACFPYLVSGTLQAPAFASGSGRVDVPSTGQTGAVTLAPAACPAQ
jgi:hypothetical protein